jgi:hypothetical protein
MTISLANRYPFSQSPVNVLEQQRERTALVVSNALASMGSRMQLLLHGWLIVAWGHNLLFLIVFAAARILPKLLLTMPAGLLCDRLPRTRVLAAARWAGALACILPLAGYLMPLPLAWLIAGIILSASTQVFDQPARRATLGDITEREDLGPFVALNNGGAHAASLCGTALAFALGPAGLLVAATFLMGAALATRALGPVSLECEPETAARCAKDGFLSFMLAAPMVSGLLVLGVAPPLFDKGLALAMPSFHENWATMSLALLAPDVGAIAAATLLFLRPARLPLGWIVASVACYAVLLTGAFTLVADPVMLVGGLALAGMAKSVFDTTSQVRVLQVVPAALRGRVFAI